MLWFTLVYTVVQMKNSTQVSSYASPLLVCQPAGNQYSINTMENNAEFSQLTTNLGDNHTTQQVVSCQKATTSSLPVSILGT